MIVTSFQDLKLCEKQISATFSDSELINSLQKWYKSVLFVRNKKMSEKSVFRKASTPEMTSQSLPVSCFWSRGMVLRSSSF